MRLIIALMLLMGVSFSTTAVPADTTVDERKPLEMKMMEDKKVQLIYKANPNGLLHVKIYDENNVLMIRDRIAVKNPFTKMYDFSHVAPGKYILALHDAKGEVERLEIDVDKPSFDKKVYTKVQKIAPNKFKLLVNALYPSDITVYIYDKGKLVYEDREPNAKGLHKINTLDLVNNWDDIEFRVSTKEGFSKFISAAD
ncbi:hypothetical protein [Negadavirga shengliensis]|uniref:Secreted protein (Por secretion system target) n=1 Tax=Negadavirga shengliensis TaxID=1389218 RepID=A0ABV9SXP8_9BACT